MFRRKTRDCVMRRHVLPCPMITGLQHQLTHIMPSNICKGSRINHVLWLGLHYTEVVGIQSHSCCIIDTYNYCALMCWGATFCTALSSPILYTALLFLCLVYFLSNQVISIYYSSCAALHCTCCIEADITQYGYSTECLHSVE